MRLRFRKFVHHIAIDKPEMLRSVSVEVIFDKVVECYQVLSKCWIVFPESLGASQYWNALPWHIYIRIGSHSCARTD